MGHCVEQRQVIHAEAILDQPDTGKLPAAPSCPISYLSGSALLQQMERKAGEGKDPSPLIYVGMPVAPLESCPCMIVELRWASVDAYGS